MRVVMISYLFSLFFGVFLAFNVYADSNQIKIGVDTTYPPFSYKTDQGELAGFDVDIGNAMCSEMKLKCVWVEQDFDGLIPSLNVRKIDAIISSMTITDQRKKAVLFSDSYYSTPARIVMTKGVEEENVENFLKGKKIGVQRGTTSDRYASDKFTPSGINVVKYNSQNEANLDLIAGRIDAVMADALTLSSGLLKSKMGSDLQFVGSEYNDSIYFGDGAGIAVNKNNSVLVGKFNDALKKIVENGTYKKVQDKYFDIDIYHK